MQSSLAVLNKVCVYTFCATTLQVHSCWLQVQYRMHPLIAEFPNQHIYKGRLIDGIGASDRSPPPGFLCTSNERPVLLIDLGESDLRPVFLCWIKSYLKYKPLQERIAS